MIATVRKHPNALTAMARTQFCQATVQTGKMKRRFLRSNIRNHLLSSKREKSLKNNYLLQLTATPASQKVLVYTLNVLTLKHKETYNIQLKSSASGGIPPPKNGQTAGGGPQPALQTNAGGKPRPAPKPSTSLFNNHKDGAAAGSGRPKHADQKNAPKKEN